MKAIVEACPTCIDVPDKDGGTPLHTAAGKGNYECVNVLLSAGCDPLITDEAGDTPAHHAAFKTARPYTGRAGDTLKAIIEACPACIDVQNTRGLTPLHYAASIGNYEGDSVLVSAGCDPLITNEDGKTAYDRAQSYSGVAELIEP